MQSALFTLNITSNTQRIDIGSHVFNAQGMKASDAYTLWSKGFSGVEMTKAGAKRMLAAASPADLSELILKLAKTPAEVEAMRSVSPRSPLVREAARKRLEQLAALAITS